jgi:hypothetical protein
MSSMFQSLTRCIVVAPCTVSATNAFAQSAKEIPGASPCVAIQNESAPRLIVDPPLAEGLAQGVFWAQYRVENLRIVPVFGAGDSPSITACCEFAHNGRRPSPGGGPMQVTTTRSTEPGCRPANTR